MTAVDESILPVADARDLPMFEEVSKAFATFEELENILENDIEGDGAQMANGFVQSNDLFSPVIIRLKPGKAIPEEFDEHHDIIGVVLACEGGKVLLSMDLAQPMELYPYDDFAIPAGVHYSLQNNSTSNEAILKFLINL